MKFSWKILFIVCVSTFTWSSPVPKDDPATGYLLPDSIIPLEYDLTINTHLEKFADKDFAFDGIAVITLQVQESNVKQIILHAKNLSIDSEKLKLEQIVEPPDFKAPVNTIKTDYNASTNMFFIDVDNPLISGSKYKLTLVYDGMNEDDMQGFYRGIVLNEQEQTRWFLATQFASVHARRAFPCFDEPRFKAFYTITVTIDAKWQERNQYRALANTELTGVGLSDDGTRVLFRFDKSPLPLSSYLVAFVVSDFEGTKDAQFVSNYPDVNDRTEKKFRTWGQKRYINKYQMGTLSQLAGPAAIEVLTQRLKVGYAYSKIDMVGLPEISPNAMENWGLITFKERVLLFNEDAGSEATRQSAVTIITHELAHQWFGNLVTLHWWSDIWLNEGFATFFQYHATNDIENGDLNATSWNLIGQMVVDELQAAAFETDALENSRTLTSNVEKPEEIDALFDSIPYSKGGSVIRMWMHVLGSSIFYDGLNKYLTAAAGEKYIGAPGLLFKAFDEAISQATNDGKPNLGGAKNSQEAFQTWLDNPGYPVVTVASEGNLSYKLSSERFFVKPSTAADDANSPWYIPLSYYTDKEGDSEDTRAVNWISANKRETSITLTTEGASWIVVNTQETGFYRVNYDESNWNALTKALNDEREKQKIHEINRAQIINDALSLARSTAGNYLSYDTALELTTYLFNETEYLPWKAALNSFDFLITKLAPDARSYSQFKKHVLGLLKNRFDRLTLTVDWNDSALTRLLRSQIVDWACKLGHKDCVDEANRQFEVAIIFKSRSKEQIHPDVKSTIYCSAVRDNTVSSAYYWVLQWYYDSTDNYEQALLLSALGCTKDVLYVQQLLTKTINGEIKRQDRLLAFNAICNGNPENVPEALKFLREHLLDIQKYYGGMNPLGDLLVGIAAKLTTPADEDAMSAILSDIQKNPELAAAEDKAKDAVEIVKSNLLWLNSKKPAISQWLAQMYPDDDDGNGGAALIIVNTFIILFSVALNLFA